MPLWILVGIAFFIGKPNIMHRSYRLNQLMLYLGIGWECYDIKNIPEKSIPKNNCTAAVWHCLVSTSI